MRFIALTLGLMLTPALSPAKTLKIATLAPKGSAWMNLFEEAARNIKTRTKGRVKFRYFAGGKAGDERDTIRKVRLGQLHGTAVTSVGLGQIYPDLRVLELPFMFENNAELDHVRRKLANEFESALEKRGYVLIGWGDVRAIGSLVLYLLLGVLALLQMRRKGVFSFSVLYFIATLSIVSNLLFSVGTFMNERFVYMPSVAFCLFLAWVLIERLPVWFGKYRVAGQALGMVMVFVFAVGFTVKTFARVPAWKNTMSTMRIGWSSRGCLADWANRSAGRASRRSIMRSRPARNSARISSIGRSL